MAPRPSTVTLGHSAAALPVATSARRRLRSPRSSASKLTLSACASRFIDSCVQAQPCKQLPIALDVRIAGGEEFLAVENRVRAGEKAQRLQLVTHAAAAGREA